MRKKGLILTAVLCFGIYMAAQQPGGRSVQAKERRAEQAGVWELASCGNMIYQDGGNKARIYAADFSLLREKLSSVSGEVFDPFRYDHTSKVVSGDGAAYDLDNRLAEEEKLIMPEQESLPEIIEEEPVTLEPEEPTEGIGEESVTSEPEITEEEVPETGKDEAEPEEVSETEKDETEMLEPEEQPEISVSGNDCAGSGIQSGTKETIEESAGEEGENL